MIGARADPRSPRSGTPWSSRQRWLERGRALLSSYRPRLRDWRFWSIQAMVLAVAIIHGSLEILGVLESISPDHGSLSYVPISLFFIPVVTAALGYGSAGAVPTVLWCALLAIPNLLLFHGGIGRVGELFQLGLVGLIGIFAGQRVDRDRTARQRAEAANAALRASEASYRALFESSPAAILVLDPAGVILEANPASALLFGRETATFKGVPVADLVGLGDVAALLGQGRRDEPRQAHLVVNRGDGLAVYLEPILTQIGNGRSRPVVQVLLQDVTEERERQAGLRAYAAHVLRAQEEERKRVAQELHDETIQKLVLLCRQLDYTEGAGGPIPASVIAGLRDARRSVEEILEELRDFARALRPPTLDDLGLVSSIRRLLEDLAERERIEVDLDIVGDERRLPSGMELAMFRIAQQALRNVERHASATQATVTIAFDDRGARLDVHDNGIGFILPAGVDLAASGHLGLLGMRERAEQLGGRLGIRSSPGCGTQVTASFPQE